MYIYKSFRQPEDNILFDDDLLEFVSESNSFLFRIWESETEFIVKGISCPDEDINFSEAGKRSVPVLRRRSGGGTVVQGPGCLNYCAVFFTIKTPDIKGCFDLVLDALKFAFAKEGIMLERKGISDLVLRGKKVSGNAQRRKRNRFYVHGTVLYDFDINNIQSLLNMPGKMPQYRANRPHNEFLDNIPLSRELVISCLFNAYELLGKDRGI